MSVLNSAIIRQLLSQQRGISVVHLSELKVSPLKTNGDFYDECSLLLLLSLSLSVQ